MLEIDPVNFMAYFAVSGLLSVILVWLVIRLYWAKQALHRKRRRVTCRLCQLRYLNVSDEPLSSCPHCGGKNQRGGQRRL